MKILYLSNGLTHYYNLVLSRLNSIPGVEVVTVIPQNRTSHIGEGVYQTSEGANFKIHEVPEISYFRFFTSYRGLAQLLNKEKPDIVIALEHLLFTFVINLPVIITMKKMRIKLILKSIPFRILKYSDAKNQAKEKSKTVRELPSLVRKFIEKTNLEIFLRLGFVHFRKLAFNVPDAHVNYIDDAYEIYGSYGVSRERIFITTNSPDTDHLREIEKSLLSAQPVLSHCAYRLIHVGRLVEWKKVDLLLRAFAKVKITYPKAELLIVGFGPVENQLRELSVSLGVADSVKFVGGVYDHKLLAQYFLASTVYVLAGMGGLSINEAMFYRLPIICSVCDGTEKKLVRDGVNGFIFEENNENDLIQKIITLFSNLELAKKMGQRSRDIIDNEININTVIEGYMKAFNYVMRNSQLKN